MRVGREILDKSEEFLCTDKENGKNEFVRVTGGMYKGKPHFDVRTFYTDLGELQPGKGAMLPIQFAVPVALSALRAAGIDTYQIEQEIRNQIDTGEDEE